MFKKLGILTALILGVVLLAYSASRSLDFIRLTLPPNRAVLAYFGLAALDGGLIAWLLSYLYGARGWQRVIAFIMILVDLAGAVGMFTLDTLYNTGKAGMTKALTPEELETAVIVLSGIIALNIMATVAHHMTDPDQLRMQAEEEAFEKVEDATLKQISKNADSLAAQIAPTLAEDWKRQTEARYMANIGTPKVGTIIDATAQDVTPKALPEAKPAPASPKALWAGLVSAATRKRQPARVAPAASETPPAPPPPPIQAEPPQDEPVLKVMRREFTFHLPFTVWFVGRDLAEIRVYHHGKALELSKGEYRISHDGILESVGSYPFGKLTSAEIAQIQAGKMPACFLREKPEEEPAPRPKFDAARRDEPAVLDVIDAGQCACPPEFFKEDAREVPQELAIRVKRKGYPRCWDGKYRYLEARASELCEQCAFFAGAPSQ